MVIMKIRDNIRKIALNSNSYLLDLDKKIVIDAGDFRYKEEYGREFLEICRPEDVEIVIFTHLHHDHIGNFELFSNAKFYASKEAIESLSKDRSGTILNENVSELFDPELIQIPDQIEGMRVMKTPGHTKGCICILYEDILFSGDTLFGKGIVGRTDLPTSVGEKMEGSLEKIRQLKYGELCPGHDY